MNVSKFQKSVASKLSLFFHNNLPSFIKNYKKVLIFLLQWVIMCNAFVCVGHMAAYEFYGHMAELVDAPVSGTGGATHGSSSLLMPTILRGTLRVASLCLCVRQSRDNKKSSGVVAQLIERYVRIVEVVGLSPISSTILRQGFGWQVTVC